MTAKQLGLEEDADANSDESPSLAGRGEEREEEGEAGEEGDREGDISEEGRAFLKRLVSELERDEGEPPRRRRPAEGPTVCGMPLLCALFGCADKKNPCYHAALSGGAGRGAFLALRERWAVPWGLQEADGRLSPLQEHEGVSPFFLWPLFDPFLT